MVFLSHNLKWKAYRKIKDYKWKKTKQNKDLKEDGGSKVHL